MSNSAFQQRQTGNASESGAGSVEEATAAEVAAKTDVGGSGAKLFVPPSKLPLPGTVDSFNAYEDIVAGDAVGLSYQYPATETTYDNFANADSIEPLNGTASTFIAQRFTMPTLATGGTDVLASQTLYLRVNSGTTSRIGQVRVRETIDGPDLYTGTWNNLPSGGWVNCNVGNNLVPGNTYFIVAWQSSADVAPNVYYSSTNANPPIDSQAYISTDGGVNFTPQNDRNYIIRIDTVFNGALGHYEIFKASAAALDNRFGFYGFATEAATAGNPVTVKTGRVYDTFTGLTADRTYYLSDTAGAISTTPGTRRLPIGRSINTTTLYRDSDFGEPISGVTSLYAQMEFLQVTDGGGGFPPQRIYDRVNAEAGELSYTRQLYVESEGGHGGLPVKRGDRIVTGSASRYYIIPKFTN